MTIYKNRQRGEKQKHVWSDKYYKENASPLFSIDLAPNIKQERNNDNSQ